MTRTLHVISCLPASFSFSLAILWPNQITRISMFEITEIWAILLLGLWLTQYFRMSAALVTRSICWDMISAKQGLFVSAGPIVQGCEETRTVQQQVPHHERNRILNKSGLTSSQKTHVPTGGLTTPPPSKKHELRHKQQHHTRSLEFQQLANKRVLPSATSTLPWGVVCPMSEPSVLVCATGGGSTHKMQNASPGVRPAPFCAGPPLVGGILPAVDRQQSMASTSDSASSLGSGKAWDGRMNSPMELGVFHIHADLEMAQVTKLQKFAFCEPQTGLPHIPQQPLTTFSANLHHLQNRQ